MNNELHFPDPAPDRQVAGALQPLLAPPVDDGAYWDGLHRRIMARVAAGSPSTSAWWMVSPNMARAGLIAAGLALLALSALARQTREIEARMAVQSVTETELEVARIIPGIDEPYGTAARTPDSAQRR
jgi:hypothetical protein